MATTYHVRIYCEDGSEYYRTTQTTIDESVACATHPTGSKRDFVIEETEVTA